MLEAGGRWVEVEVKGSMLEVGCRNADLESKRSKSGQPVRDDDLIGVARHVRAKPWSQHL
eukprot:4482328-Pyramimonas_sp.AAC.1